MSENQNWFYDNQFHLASHPRLPGVIHIDRIYCLKFDEFSDADWEKLAQILPSLPGWQGDSVSPLWFGREESDESDNVHLWASVEPSGYQVSGNLTRNDWDIWKQAFEARASELPQFLV